MTYGLKSHVVEVQLEFKGNSSVQKVKKLSCDRIKIILKSTISLDNFQGPIIVIDEILKFLLLNLAYHEYVSSVSFRIILYCNTFSHVIYLFIFVYTRVWFMLDSAYNCHFKKNRDTYLCRN